MKDLPNKLKKGERNLVLCGATVLGFAFGTGKAEAQQQTKNYLNFLNPFVAEFFDTKNTRDYYGSGDANGDGILTLADVTAMQAGTTNYRCDVDGNGLFSTSNDRQIVSEVITGQRKGVPFDWNRTETVDQRKWIIQKYLELDDTWVYDSSKSNWDCKQYSWCSLFKTNGVENATESPWWIGFGEEEGVGQQVGDKLERWKIPTYLHYSDTYSGTGHASIAVYVGSDDPTKDTPLEYENWLVYNSTTGEFDLKPGHPLINKDGKIGINRKVYSWSNFLEKFIYGEGSLITFNLSNGADTYSNPAPGLVTSRPTNPVSGIDPSCPNTSGYFLSVFPNPFTCEINVSLPEFQNVWLYLMDLDGRVLFKTPCIAPLMKIRESVLGKLPAGAYFIQAGRERQTVVKVQ